MLNLEQVRQFLYYEARLLDDRQWDEWLSCYSPQVVSLDAGVGRR